MSTCPSWLRSPTVALSYGFTKRCFFVKLRVRVLAPGFTEGAAALTSTPSTTTIPTRAVFISISRVPLQALRFPGLPIGPEHQLGRLGITDHLLLHGVVLQPAPQAVRHVSEPAYRVR